MLRKKDLKKTRENKFESISKNKPLAGQYYLDKRSKKQIKYDEQECRDTPPTNPCYPCQTTLFNRLGTSGPRGHRF